MLLKENWVTKKEYQKAVHSEFQLPIQVNLIESECNIVSLLLQLGDRAVVVSNIVAPGEPMDDDNNEDDDWLDDTEDDKWSDANEDADWLDELEDFEYKLQNYR